MNDVYIEVNNLKKYYPVSRGIKSLFDKQKLYVKALDDISFQIKKGEILGLAGESGSGKTTTGEILVKLQDITDGEITIDGHEFLSENRKEEKEFRREVQMIFQDPYETLNPRFTIFETISEPLKIYGEKNKDVLYDKVIEALEIAELRPAEHYIYRYPHELSGGQRQRVAIARGIVIGPSFLVADEPVSMLDVSIRADILNLLKSLRKNMGLTMLYISHDLSTIKYLCDRIAIMYLGKIVEIGNVDDVITKPQHPYTKVLLSSVPVADPDHKRQRIDIDDELPDQINLPKGCRFEPRCPFSKPECLSCDHSMTEINDGHFSACIFKENELVFNQK